MEFYATEVSDTLNPIDTKSFEDFTTSTELQIEILMGEIISANVEKEWIFL